MAMNSDEAQRGFTLIETLIALVILSIALAAMIPMLIYTVRGNTFGRETTQAASYSQDLLEKLRAQPFQVGGNPNPLLTAGTHANPTSQEYALLPGFTRSWNVIDTGGIYATGIIIGIEATTTWTDSQGVAHPASAFTVKVAN